MAFRLLRRVARQRTLICRQLLVRISFLLQHPYLGHTVLVLRLCNLPGIDVYPKHTYTHFPMTELLVAYSRGEANQRTGLSF